MIEELEKLIDFIQIEYIEFNKKWKESNYYSKINLRNNLVCDLLDNELILETVFNYREFINESNIQLIMDFKQFNTENSKVNIRTKTKNSIEYKIKNYIENHENGEIPIDKCLNDLFGIRIIMNKRLTHNQIMEFVKTKYKNLKCIDSSKKEYKAIFFRNKNWSRLYSNRFKCTRKIKTAFR